MNTHIITFENLPQAVSQLIEKVDSLTTLLESKSSNTAANDRPMSINEAATFLKLSVPTIYGFVSRREIPFSKLGKRLYFTEAELTEWIKTGRKSTRAELSINVDCILTPKKHSRK